MSYFTVLTISIIISILIGYLLTPKDSSWRKSLLNGIIGALIGTLTPTLVYTQYSLEELLNLRSRIVNQNRLRLLDAKIHSMDKSMALYESYKIYFKKIESELGQALNGTLKLDDEEEVIDEWKRIFLESKSRYILATNIITPSYWLNESSFSRDQLKIQKNAIENDYTIHRILIYENSNTNFRLLDSLAKQQRIIGVDIRFLALSEIRSNYNYMKQNAKIKGTEDFVIADYNSVLLTISNPKNKMINHGYITNERKRVDAAIEIFRELWKSANKTIKE